MKKWHPYKELKDDEPTIRDICKAKESICSIGKYSPDIKDFEDSMREIFKPEYIGHLVFSDEN